MNGIKIYSAGNVESHATIQWDDESSTVCCDIVYAASSADHTASLREQLDQRLDIREPARVLTGGGFSLVLDSHMRIKALDIRTNPNSWSRREFACGETISATPYLAADFDQNGRGEIENPEIFYESQRGTLYLCWNVAATWYSVAPSVALGVSGGNDLAQLRLDGLFVPHGDKQRRR